MMYRALGCVNCKKCGKPKQSTEKLKTPIIRKELLLVLWKPLSALILCNVRPLRQIFNAINAARQIRANMILKKHVIREPVLQVLWILVSALIREASAAATPRPGEHKPPLLLRNITKLQESFHCKNWTVSFFLNHCTLMGLVFLKFSQAFVLLAILLYSLHNSRCSSKFGTIKYKYEYKHKWNTH